MKLVGREYGGLPWDCISSSLSQGHLLLKIEILLLPDNLSLDWTIKLCYKGQVHCHSYQR